LAWHTGARRRLAIEHWQDALDQGAIAGASDQIKVFVARERRESTHPPIRVGAKPHVRSVHVPVTAAVGVSFRPVRGEVAARRGSREPAPGRDAHHAQDHVGIGAGLAQQPVGVDHAVGVGGGVPDARIVEHCLFAQRARVGKPRRPRRPDIARVDGDEMHVSADLSGQCRAAVVAAVEHHDDRYRQR
jgi:hypothetical protein